MTSCSLFSMSHIMFTVSLLNGSRARRSAGTGSKKKYILSTSMLQVLVIELRSYKLQVTCVWRAHETLHCSFVLFDCAQFRFVQRTQLDDVRHVVCWEDFPIVNFQVE